MSLHLQSLLHFSTLSAHSELQLAPSIRSHKLWCQARALLTHVCLATEMSARKLICYFSSHHAAFRFWSITPPGNIILTSASRKADQNFRLALVLLLMPLLTQSNSSVTSELSSSILFLLCPIQREVLYLCPKCLNGFSRFMTFWTMLCPNELGTQLVF